MDDAMGSQRAGGDGAESRLRDYRLAEFFSSLATVVDLLRETVEEMEGEDGLTDAGEHSYRAAKSAIAALASAEMNFYEDDGVEAAGFADFYHAIGEAPPPGARAFAQFPMVETTDRHI